MDHAAADVSAETALDRFFTSFYARRPVTATFTGLHDHDGALPEWSPEALDEGVAEMRAVARELEEAGADADPGDLSYPADVDRALARACLEIQIAEHEGRHFYRRNPALWTGEAVFGVLSLVTRPFGTIDQRLQAAVARLIDVAAFLRDSRRTLQSSPPEWRARALRECDAAEILFNRSLPAWLPGSGGEPHTVKAVLDAMHGARDACRAFAIWLREDLARDDGPYAAGEPFLSLVLRRGHWCSTSLDDLSADATLALDEAHAALDARIGQLGAATWPEIEARIAAERPTASTYLDRFAATWTRFRDAAVAHDLVTWPDAPIRYVPIPPHTREAAPLLYYLFYRSPAPFDPVGVYDYVVTPIDGLAAGEVEQRLAAANHCTIALNHVVHHGGLGHHVQNWYAARCPSRIGQVAAVDAASRIAMFCGGSLAEGWACYVCDLMEEIGALTPLECAAVQHTRVRLAARAVVDLALHRGRMSLDEAAAFFTTRGLMAPGTARAEAVKASMFPGTAMMYWLGTSSIHELRRRLRIGEAGAPTLRQFHDRFLSYGAIPVPLIARLMA